MDTVDTARWNVWTRSVDPTCPTRWLVVDGHQLVTRTHAQLLAATGTEWAAKYGTQVEYLPMPRGVAEVREHDADAA